MKKYLCLGFLFVFMISCNNDSKLAGSLLKEAQILGMFSHTSALEELEYISSHYIEDENVQYWIKKVRDQSRLRKCTHPRQL